MTHAPSSWEDRAVDFITYFLHDMLLKKNATCFSERLKGSIMHVSISNLKKSVSISNGFLCYFTTSVFSAITSSMAVTLA